MSLSFLSKIFILFFINSKPLEEETHPLLPKTSNLIVFLVFKVVKFALQFVSYIGLLQQQVGKERWKKRNSWMFFCFGAFGSFESWGLHANIGMVCKVQFFLFFFPFLQLPRSPLCYVCFLSCEINLNSFWKRGDNIKS